MNILYNIKKYLFCFIFHYKQKCYPEVWKEKSNWHCKKCHPCSEAWTEIEKALKEKQNEKN